MQVQPVVGHISWSPDYLHHAQEAGDITMVRSASPPKAANDNRKLPKIVGLMGYGGSGKSETAKILTGIGYTRLHIKGPLRATCATLLREAGIDDEMIDRYLDGDLKRETIPQFKRSGTELQQFLGTEFGRDFCYGSLWLDLWLAAAGRILRSGGRVTQESVRFANEAAAIRGMGGVVVEVRRPGVGPLSGHVSEVLPTTPDIVIDNTGSISDLRQAVTLALAA